MDYAAILCFDEETEFYFSNIVTAIAQSGASSYMLDAKTPPHITIADFHTDEIDNVVSEINRNISDFAAGSVAWVSLGAFAPRVLFAAPVMNEYLLNACTNINRLIKPLAPHCGFGQYLPFQWVPHTTLASRLDNDSLSKAFDVAAKEFSAVRGKCTKLMIVQCSPYKEVKSWSLN